MSPRLLFAARTVGLFVVLGGCTTSRRMPTIVERPVAVPATDVASALAEARSMYLRQEYGLAIGAFRAAIRLSPDDATGYDGLAACYDRLGRFDLSRRYYEVALAFAPNEARIYRNLAASLRLQGRDEEARVVLADAAALPNMAAPAGSPPPAAERASSAAAAEPWGGTKPGPSVAVALDPAAPIPMPDWIGQLFQKLAERAPLSIPADVASRQTPPMLILNANGRTGLATRARARLAGTAWRHARMANAPVRLVSEIVYPSGEPALADQIRGRMPFPVRLRPSRSVNRITLWLGADATIAARRQQRG